MAKGAHVVARCHPTARKQVGNIVQKRGELAKHKVISHSAAVPYFLVLVVMMMMMMMMMILMMTFTLTISKCFVGFQIPDYVAYLIVDMQPRGEDLSRTQVQFRCRLARRHRPSRGIGDGRALRRSAWGLRRRGTRGATAKKGTSGRSDYRMEKE